MAAMLFDGGDRGQHQCAGPRYLPQFGKRHLIEFHVSLLPFLFLGRVSVWLEMFVEKIENAFPVLRSRKAGTAVAVALDNHQGRLYPGRLEGFVENPALGQRNDVVFVAVLDEKRRRVLRDEVDWIGCFRQFLMLLDRAAEQSTDGAIGGIGVER